MTDLAVTATAQPGSLPGIANGQAAPQSPLGVFAALLSALSTDQTALETAAAEGNPLAQLLLAQQPGTPRPDLAAGLGEDVEATVVEGGAAPGETAESPEIALPVSVIPIPDETASAQTETDAPPAIDEAPVIPAAAPVETAAPTEPAKVTGLENAAQRVGDRPGAEGIANALTRGNRRPAPAPQPGPAATPATPASTAPAATPATPAIPADPETPAPAPVPAQPQQRAAVDAPAEIAPAGDTVDTDRPQLPEAATDKRPSAAPSRPAVVNFVPSSLTAQTLVSLQESPSADTIPLGASGGAGQALQLKPAYAPPPPSPAAPAIPLQGIAVHIAQQAQSGARRFDIRLDPPELGRIEVRLDVNREGHVHTHLVVERSETLDLLQRDSRQLERALQDAGLDTSQGSMKFSLKEHGAGQHGAREGSSDHYDVKTKDGTEDMPEEQPVWQGRAYTGRIGLDIRI
ncbi:MAG: flagellar hook-length control protein FliK [Pseudomonadota bacterium]|nr:flagellar hook-length control protein FliK [Pseudomonadota bacterium]